jgi:hypothetical protein
VARNEKLIVGVLLTPLRRSLTQRWIWIGGAMRASFATLWVQKA